MGAGKVDYDNLWKNAQYRAKHIRWRRLRCIHNGAEIAMFGYPCHKDGPWFGYPSGSLVDANCAHCGQVGVFANGGPYAAPSEWAHVCPGHHNGKQLPCLEDHACRGEPSMATAPMWRSADWIEIEV